MSFWQFMDRNMREAVLLGALALCFLPFIVEECSGDTPEGRCKDACGETGVRSFTQGNCHCNAPKGGVYR